ncbi:kinase-like protein [Fistulina hepatica ATCC 64428]|nr:kinase-like protein [Fistulina hepatica ATCC 64428]
MHIQDFEILKLLGSGGSGRVFLARHKLTQVTLALKIIRKKGLSSNRIHDVLTEQRLLVHLSIMPSHNQQFVKLLASWNDEVNFYLAMEYLPGDMAIELAKCRKFEEKRAQFCLAEIILALETLKAQGIMHRDIKPSNLLFRPDGHIVLADFGNGRTCDTLSSTYCGPPPECHSTDPFDKDSSCGTPSYMSPEMHLGDWYSYEVDLWSTGVVLYRMLTGKMPFGHSAGTVSVAKQVIDDQLDIEEDISPAARDLLQKLLAKSPWARIKLEDIKSHPFLRGINWKRVSSRKVHEVWKPFVSQTIIQSRTSLKVPTGYGYTGGHDPYPQFYFILAEFRSRILQQCAWKADAPVARSPPVSHPLQRWSRRLFARLRVDP